MSPAPLRDRLQWDGVRGRVHDGPRRYLMMRPDVLMGAAVALDAAARAALFEALADATHRYGGHSLRAYAEQVAGDPEALLSATASAAADLGWGRWMLQRDGERLSLEVHDSPFAAGWREAGGGDATEPVCAPIRGMLAALAELLLGPHARIDECRCAAMQPGPCRFSASLGPPRREPPHSIDRP
jgi:predicted hydrocarbon binding protein